MPAPTPTMPKQPPMRSQPHLIQADEELIGNLENDLRRMAPVTPARRTANDMSRISELLSNGVTTAHDDACLALDKVLEEARALLARTEKAVADHKAMLKDEGQKIAVALEAAVQALTHTVQWVEEHGPNLRNPRLAPPSKEDADAKATE